jgi:hypothetical protein
MLVYSMEGPRARLLGLKAPKYAPSLLEIEVGLRVGVEEPLGNMLDGECIVVEVLDLQHGLPGDADEQERLQVVCGDVLSPPQRIGCRGSGEAAEEGTTFIG